VTPATHAVVDPVVGVEPNDMKITPVQEHVVAAPVSPEPAPVAEPVTGSLIGVPSADAGPSPPHHK
jgi:hypothetical protein